MATTWRATSASLLEHSAQVLDLGVATDEAREAPERRRLKARPRRSRPRQLKNLDRIGESLHGDRPERSHLDVALGEAQGLGRQPDGPRRRELFHPSGQVGGLAHGGVVHAEVRADGADDDLAGVEADADLHLDALGAAQFVGMAPDGVLHAEGGVAGAHRVVLVGQRARRTAP